MIKLPAHRNLTNPPGQIVNHFEKPLSSLIDEYTSETRHNAVKEAFEMGKVVGYHDGYLAARRRYAPNSFPDSVNSESAR